MYLDHNATSPMLPAVAAAVREIGEDCWANPSSPHAAGRRAAMALDRARQQVAALCGWDPVGVVFTSGATEANALALQSFSGRVLASAVEHPSVLVWAGLQIPVDGEGRVDPVALDGLLDAHKSSLGVVSVMAASNETGVLQPVEAVAERVRAAGLVFHCDASQVPGRLPLRIDADLLTISAHKMGGPKGAGALLVRRGLQGCLQPLLRGGPQERGLRGGTENLPAIVGMGVAATLAGSMDPGPRDRLEAAIKRLGGRILGEQAPRLPNTVSALFPHPGDLVVMGLDLEGICVSNGSACASGAAEESHVLRAMGLGGLPVRFSLGPDSTDVSPAIAALERVLGRLEVACAS